MYRTTVKTNVNPTALVTFKHLGLIIASYKLLWPPALIIRPMIRVIIGSCSLSKGLIGYKKAQVLNMTSAVGLISVLM